MSDATRTALPLVSALPPQRFGAPPAHNARARPGVAAGSSCAKEEQPSSSMWQKRTFMLSESRRLLMYVGVRRRKGSNETTALGRLSLWDYVQCRRFDSILPRPKRHAGS